MITTPKDYYNLYHRIQSENPPSLAILLPTTEKIYKIDLNKKSVEAPEYLGIENDHKSEVLYFQVNRFYDFFDLTQAVCVIQYFNALGESKIYPVPYYDIDTLSKHDSENGEQDDIILFPWIIDKEVTKVKGKIEFNIQFYLLNEDGTRFIYSLNTLQAVSQILPGMARKSNNLYRLGKISEETFEKYQLLNMPLYVKENDNSYYLSEIYTEGTIYYLDQENGYFASVKEEILQRIADIDSFDIYWEE